MHENQESQPIQIGPTIQQYGRFHLKYFEVHLKNRVNIPGSYYVTLKYADESEEFIGSIHQDKSILPDFLEYLHVWLRRQFEGIHRAKRVLSQTAEDDVARESHQFHYDDIKQRYERVVQALREIAPDFQLDESLPKEASNLEVKETHKSSENTEEA